MRILVSTVALVACTSLASAADLGGPYGDSLKDDPYVAAAPFSWTGFYVGAHAGWATGEWDGVLSTTSGSPDVGYADPSRSIDGDGWLGGGQIGYNWQRGAMVIGLEADVSWADFGGDDSFATDQYTSVWDKRHDFELEYFGTVRARLGYAAGPFMPYVTGGLAWGRTSGDLAVSYYRNGTSYEGTSFASAEENHVGWAAGAGVEWMLRSNWTLKAEWLHVDLGEEKYSFKGTTYFDTPFDSDSFPADLTFDVFRVGVNYKFGG